MTMDYLNIKRTNKPKSRERKVRERIDFLEGWILRSRRRYPHQEALEELRKLRNELQMIRKMKSYMELSEHDQKIVDELNKLDEGGYAYWPEMSHLATQLEDEGTQNYWNSVCAHYNHVEEGYSGLL